tara:strand:- start:1577 stop:1861 length:285 start_codon:yes stop_codon:yes gene_type:complete
MATTELTRMDTSIRIGGGNRLGCGHIAVAAAATSTGDFVAVQIMDPDADTALTGMVGDSGTALTVPSEMVGKIIYMNFTEITTDKDILCYNRCR